ncbi:MAG: Crp/Fnr family transcriptional regulator [Saprospiraceae bacterium]|nr:Crp/Fnr family transcriptional regulator [Saprospiraceae bacterium]
MNTSVTRVMLQKHKVFGSLKESQWDILTKNISLMSYSKNKIIYQVDDNADFVYLVEKGSVKIGSHSGQHKTMIKEITYEGDFFGENIFSQGNIRKDFAETTSEVKLFVIPVLVFKNLLLENPVFTNTIMSNTLHKLEAMEERLQNFVFLKAKERITHFLHKIALRKGINIGVSEKLINQGISHKDIAYLTDTSRQTVARVLNELKRDNIIHYGGGKSCKILIRDMFQLEKLSLVG